ncbi:hypothetical protein [Clostridium grantii]|uniref:hypothetical protein n=1 Tax=Clostridium grantii TaxID=40575 RepID=UPI001A9A42C6|nr:hypothetical protein [Clostridium grantii]
MNNVEEKYHQGLMKDKKKMSTPLIMIIVVFIVSTGIIINYDFIKENIVEALYY